ncbi:MAG TPA: DUF1330 domain-containing protein [Burkholderiaceae bacterium]|nr:DUF1330 domain-containing protein [Burkholderiaceae bacterium]
MKRGYWVSVYREIRNEEALAAYAALSGPAIAAGGGRFVARGLPSHVFEDGLMERTVIIEFASAQQAIDTYRSPAYQDAVKVLNGAVVREIRIIEEAI